MFLNLSQSNDLTGVFGRSGRQCGVAVRAVLGSLQKEKASAGPASSILKISAFVSPRRGTCKVGDVLDRAGRCCRQDDRTDTCAHTNRNEPGADRVQPVDDNILEVAAGGDSGAAAVGDNNPEGADGDNLLEAVAGDGIGRATGLARIELIRLAPSRREPRWQELHKHWR